MVTHYSDSKPAILSDDAIYADDIVIVFDAYDVLVFPSIRSIANVNVMFIFISSLYRFMLRVRYLL